MTRSLFLGALASLASVALSQSLLDDLVANKVSYGINDFVTRLETDADGLFVPLTDALGNVASTLTVFAPDDAAWSAAGADTLSDADLLPILYYHLIGVKVLAADISIAPAFDAGPTLLTSALYPATVFKDVQVVIATNTNDVVTINDATVTGADNEAALGVTHVIDTVLIPPKSTSEVAVDAGLDTLVAALTAQELVDTVNTANSVTIFAPTDGAFANLGAGLDAALPGVYDVLLDHVFEGLVYSSDLNDGDVLTAASGKNITVTIDETGVYIGHAKVAVANVLTANAVVHVTEEVLISITGLLSVNADFSSLLGAVTAPVAEALDTGSGDITLFAPNNAAIPETPPTDDDFYLYHALNSRVPASAFSVEGELVVGESLLTNGVLKGGAGQAVTGMLTADGIQINGGVATVTAINDIVTLNGIVHGIDAVLPAPKITSEVATDAGLTQLVAALVKAELVDTVDTAESITIFAPVDAAFDSIDGLSELTVEELSRILTIHVVPGIAYSKDLSDMQVLTSLEGTELMVSIANGVVKVDDATVTSTDILTANAVVHLVDTVLGVMSGSALAAPGLAIVAALFLGLIMM